MAQRDFQTELLIRACILLQSLGIQPASIRLKIHEGCLAIVLDFEKFAPPAQDQIQRAVKALSSRLGIYKLLIKKPPKRPCLKSDHDST